MQIGSAVLYVIDLPAMTRFYGDVFGLTPIAGEHADVWQEFEAGAFRLGLPQIPREVPDVEKTRARLEALGVKILARPWGSCDVVDPEGNIFGLSQSSA